MYACKLKMHVLPVGGCDKEAVGDIIGGVAWPIIK